MLIIERYGLGMFTGIIEDLGEVSYVSSKNRNTQASLRLRIDIGRLSKGLKIGSSLSINGACLTVTNLHKREASFDLIEETVARTCLKLLKVTDKVNLERSLKIGDRLEGHLVLGHIDGIGKIDKILKCNSQTKIWFKLENTELLDSIVPKGSIAIDGISLTVVDMTRETISVALIPHTLAHTTLGFKAVGDYVNLETDILGKYIKGKLP
ncbi:MAG TPA: riboflavin synthase [Nitrososphaeraceae archaeon]